MAKSIKGTEIRPGTPTSVLSSIFLDAVIVVELKAAEQRRFECKALFRLGAEMFLVRRAVVDARFHQRRGNRRLTAAHVALKQTVHRYRLHHIPCPLGDSLHLS